MRISESIKNISVALNKVMNEIKDVSKNSNGYGYKYATLDEVLKVARPLCAKYGISIIQSQNINKETGFVEVDTMLLHTSGEYITTKVESPYEKLKGMNDYQSTGASITYLRRYGLSMALGISSEEDTDANAPKISNKTQKQVQTQKQNTKQVQVNNQADVNNQVDNPLKTLGIKEVEKNGVVYLVEEVKGAIYQNKNLIKDLGFKWDSQNRCWYKKVN